MHAIDLMNDSMMMKDVGLDIWGCDWWRIWMLFLSWLRQTILNSMNILLIPNRFWTQNIYIYHESDTLHIHYKCLQTLMLLIQVVATKSW